MMTKRDVVLQMLRDAGSNGVTSNEFCRAFLPRAAARILELKAEGFEIDAAWVTTDTGTRIKKYTLMEPSVPRLVTESVDERFDRLFPLPSRPHWQGDAA